MTTPGAPCIATYPLVTDYCRYGVLFPVCPSFLAYRKCVLQGPPVFPVTTTISPRTPPADLDNIDHSPCALDNQGCSNRNLPDYFTPHSTEPHHPPLLPPFTTHPGHLPNTFLVGLHLGIFTVVHLGVYSRQRALQLRRTM